jgi:ATP-dependent exoDNAse (exonuclease V) alpha subunit
MAWHDDAWSGKICDDPENNTYCTGAHSLLSGRIEKRKNTQLESKDGVKGEYVSKNFSPDNVPPCYWSINAFSKEAFSVNHAHAFPRVKHTIPDRVEPYSVFTWPFKLSFVHTDENKKIHGNYWPDLEQRIKTYIGKFKRNESIIFFYANYDNPVSADEMKYLLLGCSVVDDIISPDHFPFSEQELQKMGKGQSGSVMKNFPTLNWSMQITHQKDKAVLLPYHEYIRHIEEFPEEFERLDDIKVTIEEPSLVSCFKYVSMDLDDDKCLYLLYKIRKAIYKIREHNRQVVHHNMDEEEKRIDALIQTVWERRGIYPSLARVLGYFLKRDCTKFANAIIGIIDKKFDLLDCFEEISKGNLPDELEDYEDDIDDLMGAPQFKRHLRAYLKLSLFNLTDHQIKRIITHYHDSIITRLEENTYLIYEYYEPDSPKDELDMPDLIDEPIDVYKIDIGMIPDSRFVKRHRKIQNIHESSPERIRSLMIEYLWGLEGHGHTYDNLQNIIRNLKEYPLIFHTEASIDGKGILDMEEEYKNHFQERLHIVISEQEKYIYLKELYRAEQRIRERIFHLLARDAHTDQKADYQEHIDFSVEKLKRQIAEFDEEQFRKERGQLYKNIFSKSLFLLTGKPGSGKTFETSHVIIHLKSLNQGLEILAPTGKAALRISENIKANTELEIKANTIDRFIFENGFWWAYDDWDRLHELPETEKLTVTNLIIDESSMLDLQKLYILFSIIRFDDSFPKRIIFVGDENQLPPIGFGKPFHDIINYVVSKESFFNQHYIHLLTNCRQENDLNIVKLSEAFSDKTRYFEESLNLLSKKGKVSDGLEIYYWKSKNELFETIEQRLKNLLDEELREEQNGIDEFILREDSDSQKDFLRQRRISINEGLINGTDMEKFNLVLGLYKNGFVPGAGYGFKKSLNLENLQILSPYRPGYFGVLGLNKMVQSSFRNTSSYKDPRTSFYHADKLIRISNYYSGYGSKKKLTLSNGSIGVLNNHKDGKKYYFRDADFVLKWIDDEDEFDLAYCITVHKAQGSDFNNVFLVIPNKLNLLNKELVYTALTRSKQRLFLFIYDDDDENLLVKSKGVSALLTRQTSTFEDPEDKRLRYYPRKNEKPVKSKAEYIIYKALQRSGLRFEYEQRLDLEKLNYPFHPDFTIELEDKTKIYWEHLGMLDTRKYFNDWMRRKEDYEDHSLLDFVITTDDMDGIKDEVIDQLLQDIREKQLKLTPESKFSRHHYQLY